VLGPFDGWKAWGAGHGLTELRQRVAFETDNYHAAALAVERGVGICLGILPFMRPWLAAQRVQMVPELATRIAQATYLVYPPHHARNRSIGRLREWLSATLA
jgi:DNA-binding transcriptional LysR family regulator